MPTETLHAHSLTEAYLYLAVTPCSICKHGATEASDVRPATQTNALRIITTCKNCGGAEEYIFQVPDNTSRDTDLINTGQEPSRIVDVAQWLTLYKLKLEQADKETDKMQKRRLSHQAGQCLEEALRFYGPDSDVPPSSAFFCDRSREAFRDHPERFARQRLVGLAAELPKFDLIGLKLEPKRPWWKFW